ncbi:MAG: ABC transporter permease, partial [Fibrobacterales bacterium]|nr:ABC transporter permease [Fibrobacterales bacterium]
ITSIPLICITSTFTGMVFSWQMAYQLAGLAPDIYIGVAVGKSVMVELGPVLVSMVMCGRIGAAMCAELGTMAVTEQLDAMKCLNLSPYRYLLAPRVVAAMIMLPVLTIVASLISILSGWAVAWLGRDVPFDIFMKGVRMFYDDWDMTVGLIKSLASGYIIAIYACYFGYTTTNGAEGVGRSTKAAVVASMTSVLIAAFVLSEILL